MRYATVCSGIEAPSVAWEPLGWEPVWFSEIEPFPSAVLAHHYPDTPNLGDMTKIDTARIDTDIDVLIGGTPCQSFSVAGLRAGLADPRGNLALEYLRLVDAIRPTWCIWENVPGVLSSGGGQDFGAILGALSELRYGWAYRILDAQWFGVAQRRRRVFLVGHSSGQWQRAAAVLFDTESLRGNPPPCRETREGASPHISSCFNCLDAQEGTKWGSNQWVSQGKPIMQIYDKAFCLTRRMSKGFNSVISDGQTPILCASDAQGNATVMEGIAPTLTTINSYPYINSTNIKVRRLTPIEAERLQGFSDNYTAIPWRNKPAEDCPDTPRYKALGNSMAVPVVRWIGERIQQVEELTHD